MGADHHLLVIAPIPLLGGSPFGSYDAPPPSSHSKELGQSWWLVFMMYPFFLWLVSYSLDLSCCLSVCLTACFILPVLTTPLFGYFTFPDTVGTRLHSPCLRPRRESSEPTRLSCFHEYDQRAREESDLGKMARSLYATEREPAWYRRVDELYKGARPVPPLPPYDWYHDLRLQRLDAEIRVCDV